MGEGPLGVLGVAGLEGGPGDRGQDLDGPSLPAALEVGEGVAQVPGQVEGSAPLGNPERVRHRVGPLTEAGRRLIRRRQVEAGVGAPAAVGAVQGGAVADGGEDVLEAVPLGAVVVDVACGHHREPQPVGQAPEGSVAGPISLHPVLLKLNEEAVGPERPGQPPGEGLPRGHGVVQGVGQRAPPAAGEQDEALGACEQHVQRQRRRPPGTRPVGRGEEPAEVRVARGGLGQKREVEGARGFVRPGGGGSGEGGRARRGTTAGIRSSRAGPAGPAATLLFVRNPFSRKAAVPDRELRARDGLKPRLPGRPGELHGPVEPVVVREGQGWVAQLPGPQDQLFGVGGPVQERERRVGVELDVGGGFGRRGGVGHAPKITRISGLGKGCSGWADRPKRNYLTRGESGRNTGASGSVGSEDTMDSSTLEELYQ